MSRSTLEKFPRERAVYLENSGWIALLKGDYKKAEKILNEGLVLSLKIAPESALISQIKRLLGDLCIATKRFDEAAKYESEARAVAVKIGQKVEIAACDRIAAQIALHRKDHEAAAQKFNAAMEIFAQITSRYELAVTRYLAATSGCHTQTESMAQLHLAKQYFDEEEVAPFIPKVNDALAALKAKAPAILKGLSITPSTSMITNHPGTLKLLEMARAIAPCGMTVMISGETGTGKDLLARYIHEYSGMKGRLVTVNIATIPTPMAEAELFGYAKGAYTGADQAKPGLLEMADNGTFFLNEIGEAPPEIQAKLLEVIETKAVRRLGELTARPVQFRLIAATNRDLAKLARDGQFRTDLYHRLTQIPITLVPLRERAGDIALLTAHFLKQCGWNSNGDAHLLGRLTELMTTRNWIGNIRQLQSTVSSLYVQSGGSLDVMIRTLECEDDGRVGDVLVECGGNKSEAARQLGISESTLRYRLRKRD